MEHSDHSDILIASDPVLFKKINKEVEDLNIKVMIEELESKFKDIVNKKFIIGKDQLS